MAAIAAASFAAGAYLEFRRLEWLQAHPFMANLLSSITAFACGFITVSFFINWFYDRQWLIDNWIHLRVASDQLRRLRRMVDEGFGDEDLHWPGA